MAFSEKQLKILAFPYSRYGALICDGAIRSGKTSIMSVAFFDDCMARYNRRRFIIGGKTVGSATRNVIEPYIAMKYARDRYDMKWQSGKSRLILKRGNKENYFDVFGGKDKSSYQLVQGFTAAGCFIDEVALCDQGFVNQCLARCSVDGSRYWFNCNPGDPMHWFKRDWIDRAEDQNALHLHFQLRDNPSLSDDIIARYERQYTGVFKQRYIEGEWVKAEGLVYPFDSEQYVMAADEIEQAVMDNRGTWYISIDYGITNPFAALLWYVTWERAYLVDEYYFDGREGMQKTNREHLESVKALAGNRRIESVIIDPSASSFKQEMYRDGTLDYQNADNSVVDGIATMGQMLADGAIKYSSKCENTIREMGLYSWDADKPGDEVIKENDHCVTGDTLICISEGDVPISELVGKSGMVWSYDGKNAVLKPFHDVRMTRETAEVYEIVTDDGRTLRCTGDHLIMTERGWVACEDLTEADRIITI